MLDMEHDYLEVFVLAGCITQKVCTSLHAGGCGGDLSPPRGFGVCRFPLAGGFRGKWSPSGGFEGSALEVENKCKIAL